MDCVGLRDGGIIDIEEPNSYKTVDLTAQTVTTNFSHDGKNYDLGIVFLEGIGTIKAVFNINAGDKHIHMDTVYFGYGCYHYQLSSNKRIVFQSTTPKEVKVYIDTSVNE